MLAAAGARVVSFDLAEEQLANKDRMVAEREGLTLETRRGDMADLSGFADGRFDLVFHPVASHSLEAQIGGQLAAGFVLIGLYEDTWTDAATPLNAFSPTSIATRTVKPERPIAPA